MLARHVCCAEIQGLPGTKQIKALHSFGSQGSDISAKLGTGLVPNHL